MTKDKEKSLEKRLQRIKRGAYWFGIIGRISIFFGALLLIFALIILITEAFGDGPRTTTATWTLLFQSLPLLIFGWLFLLGRDAFESIMFLIEERADTNGETSF